MKLLLLGLLAFGSICAFSQTPFENVSNLCNSVDKSFRHDDNSDLFKCIANGLEVYDQGKLEIFDKTCLNLGGTASKTSTVALRSMNICNKKIKEMNIPKDESYELLLVKCSKFEESYINMLNVDPKSYPHNLYIKKAFFTCMKVI
jgi:hypothetical protein